VATLRPESPDELLVGALREAYRLAKAERLSELRGGPRARTFDARGLHPWSEAWGYIGALWLWCELPWGEGLLPSAPLLREEARAEAQAEYEAELRAAGQESLPFTEGVMQGG